MLSKFTQQPFQHTPSGNPLKPLKPRTLCWLKLKSKQDLRGWSQQLPFAALQLMLPLPAPTAPETHNTPRDCMVGTLAVPRDLPGSAAGWPCCSDQTRWVAHNLCSLAGFTQAAGTSRAAECCRCVHFQRHQLEFQILLASQNSLRSVYFRRNAPYWSVYITAALRMPLLGQDLYYVRCSNTGEEGCVPSELAVSVVRWARGADKGLVRGNAEVMLVSVITSCLSTPWP